jgi:arylsulfatase
MNMFRIVTTVLITVGSAALAADRPNIVLILADDMGFSDAGCYGGEIATPNLDQLAANGLRFAQFYNTARCWPTRSCLMSGYYAQQIRMDPPKGRLPAWARLLPHHIKPLGYRSYHAGKWHVTGAPKPVADGGFDRSYWFEDWDRYFSPTNHFEDDILAPPVKPDSGYYATTAFADRAIGFLKDHAAQHAAQPFFLYLAFISPHFPLHAPQADIARYGDAYVEGWDVARERRYARQREMGLVNCALAPPEAQFSPRYFKPAILDTLGSGEIQFAVPWPELTDEQRRFQAAKMAIHAAMITRMDLEIGRVLAQLRAMGAFDNTLVLFLSDNGTDATLMVRGEGHDRAAVPGSRRSFLCLGPGWSTVGNTPFRRHKVWVHEGGISTPLIAHWPKGIPARGEWRRSPGHVIDFVPTALELAGAQPALPPGAPPLPGRSLVPEFAQSGSVEREFLFFHHEGNRGLRMGDWKLVSAREGGDAWELYDLRKDRCEQVNLARQQPAKLKEMVDFWTRQEAKFRAQAGSDQPPPNAPVQGGKHS